MLRIFLLLTILISGCEQAANELPAKSPTVNSTVNEQQTSEQIQQILVETPAEAIPGWRQHADKQPLLIILSQNPFLMPIPEPGRKAALELARDGNIADFQRWASIQVPDPLIHPDMALSLALEAELFSEIIWVLPQQSVDTPLPLETIKQKLIESGTATTSEAESFVATGQAIVGRLRQTPIRITSQHLLQPPEKPFLLHIDLTFFKAMYRNEIKTPLYSQIYQLLTLLEPVSQQAQGTSISLSNKTGAVSLQVRFVGDLLERLIESPEKLQQPLSRNDNRRSQILYLANFFQKEKRLELLLSMASDAPQDASIQYDLFGISSEFKQGDNALAYLTEAVKLDSSYALEYLSLAEVALEKKRPDAALKMLDLAAAAFPDDPFIDIRKGEILLQTGHPEMTENILYNLLQQPWSDLYYPAIRDSLRQKFATAPE